MVETTTVDEIAFAAEYCEIVSSTEYQFTLKSPMQTLHRTPKMKPTSSWGGSQLAMADRDESSDSGKDGNASYQKSSEIAKDIYI